MDSEVDFSESMLNKKLLVKNKLLLYSLIFLNRAIKTVYTPKVKKLPLETFAPKILICNIAHLGDVVLSTCVLPLIKKSYPKSEIGFLCGSWSKVVVDQHPMINSVHIVDHWKLNRSVTSWLQKVLVYIKTLNRAVKEIKAVKYDAAIDLYYYYPNTLPLLAVSQIPVRIGYTSGGYGSTVTHPLDWEDSDHSIMLYHFQLLQKLVTVDDGSKNSLNPYLAKPSVTSIEKYNKLIIRNNINSFIIFHCGTGLSSTQWPADRWKLLTTKCFEQGLNVIFTGYGEKEKYVINSIIGETGFLNTANELTFMDLTYFVLKASLVVCGDTAISHIAGAMGTSCVVIGINAGKNKQFKPFTSNSSNFALHTSMLDITVDEVYERITASSV